MNDPARSFKKPVKLREKKKAKTRLSIRKEAMNLFRKHGYEATTVEQIAEAAEVSASTFFRYFPTKRDVVLYDDLDELFTEALRSQPEELSPVEAVKRTFHDFLTEMTGEDFKEQWERQVMILETPELRAGMMEDLLRTFNEFSDILSERMNRGPGDPYIRTLVSAITGIQMAFFMDLDKYSALLDDPSRYLKMIDESFRYLEKGFSNIE